MMISLPPGVRIDPPRMRAIDETTDRIVALNSEELCLLGRLIDFGSHRNGPIDSTPFSLEDSSIRHLAGLGLVNIRMRPRFLLKSFLTGRFNILQSIWRMGTRRLPAGPSLIHSALSSIRAAISAFWAPTLIFSIGFGMISLHLNMGGEEFFGALIAPMCFTASLGVHEFAHLRVLRRILKDNRRGALLVGPLRLAVTRPQLQGRPLRLVALAGPVGGIGAGVAIVAIPTPWCTFVGFFSICYHLANAWPWAHDGRHIWTGKE
ncbi:hypothetical protein HD592_000797 [Schaalia hyovaginalis]|uniref:DUF3267 domain-containing protein n=2 Tax=Schaalia hyovaginalis TaxID=29316 RepID=A0A923E3P7_9ACTO|nr:hypothetical protein [Schaalia hyovaginalis]